jgi:hypothetical protein
MIYIIVINRLWQSNVWFNFENQNDKMDKLLHAIISLSLTLLKFEWHNDSKFNFK